MFFNEITKRFPFPYEENGVAGLLKGKRYWCSGRGEEREQGAKRGGREKEMDSL